MAIGPLQLLLIALVILLLFGATRLSDLGKGLGEGIRNFRRGLSDDGPDKLSSADRAKQLPAKDSSQDGQAARDDREA
jgi:sec-independent protein translocase protein TatA